MLNKEIVDELEKEIANVIDIFNRIHPNAIVEYIMAHKNKDTYTIHVDINEVR